MLSPEIINLNLKIFRKRRFMSRVFGKKDLPYVLFRPAI
jgi:hypothetical protein